MSPEGFDYIIGVGPLIYTAGMSLSNDCSGDFGEEHAIRPSISLVSDITISGGAGTSEDPYIVNW